MRLTDLPPGVTATTGILPPDDDKITLILTAAPDAAPSAKVTSISAIVTGENGPAARRARIMEDFRYNGQVRYFPRSAAIVSVAKIPAPYSLRWKAGQREGRFHSE